MTMRNTMVFEHISILFAHKKIWNGVVGKFSAILASAEFREYGKDLGLKRKFLIDETRSFYAFCSNY